MRRIYDCAVLALLLDALPDLLARGRVNTRSRLVDEHHTGAANHRHSAAEFSLVAAGKVA